MMRQFGREKYEQQGIGMGLGLARNFAQFGGGDFTVVRNVLGPGMTACLKLVRAGAGWCGQRGNNCTSKRGVDPINESLAVW